MDAENSGLNSAPQSMKHPPLQLDTECLDCEDAQREGSGYCSDCQEDRWQEQDLLRLSACKDVDDRSDRRQSSTD